MWQAQLTWENAKERAKFLRQIREFFYQRNVVEVETPLLSSGTVTDPYLDAFNTISKAIDTNPSYNLQTSPEFAMKRLLASGYQSIYQICKAFRDEECGKFHNPEFTMLEWYRVGFNMVDLIDEVDFLLQDILKCNCAEKVTYQSLFIREMSLDPLIADIASIKITLKENEIQGDWIDGELNKDTLLQVLFSECIEKRIGLDRPICVTNFPASQASLAQITEKDSRVADRFEFYYKGIELANGFCELTDVKEQKLRFESDNNIRLLINKKQKPLDINFLNALENGVPACSGVALGVDRLIMLALNLTEIKDSLTFDFNRA